VTLVRADDGDEGQQGPTGRGGRGDSKGATTTWGAVSVGGRRDNQLLRRAIERTGHNGQRRRTIGSIQRMVGIRK